MNSKQLIDLVCEITYKNERLILVDEVFHAMLTLIDLWNWAHEKGQILNDLIRYFVEKHSQCKNPDHIDYLCDSLVKNSQDIVAIDDIEKRLQWIDIQPDVPQRSQAWYDYRHGVITASSMHQIFHTESSYKCVLKEKVLPLKSFKTNAACEHGIKYEPVAQSIYEHMQNVTIAEYGCIKHPSIEYIGASPDGIVREANDPKLKGRMLEIKCLYSRRMTGVPLYKYWIQVQIQLEVCNLEYCDFLECKINESHSEDEFYKAVSGGKMSNDYYGIVLQYENDSVREYKYSLLGQSEEQLKEWKEIVIDELLENPNIEFGPIRFWTLDKHSIRTIKRNRDWFDLVKGHIEKFWNDVEETRRMYTTNPNIFDTNTCNSRPVNSYRLNLNECMIDDDY